MENRIENMSFGENVCLNSVYYDELEFIVHFLFLNGAPVIVEAYESNSYAKT